MKYLALKITDSMIIDHFVLNKSLIELLQIHWRITPRKTVGVTRAIAIYKGTIIGEFQLTDNHIVHASDNRMSFKFLQVPKQSGLVGQSITYRTSNPASVIDKDKLDKLIQNNEV